MDADAFLKKRGMQETGKGMKLSALLMRPGVRYEDIRQLYGHCPELEEDIALQIETNIKYAGYIDKQLKQVAAAEALNKKQIPPEIDYTRISGLRLEARAKLNDVRPLSVGQASRISGVSPADISVLLVYLASIGK